jgi:hypothetical protein
MAAPTACRIQKRWRFLFTPLFLWVLLIVSKEDKEVSSEVSVSSTTTSYSVLQSPHRIQQVGASFARPYSKRDKKSWCTKEAYILSNGTDYEFVEPKGLYYVKVPKTASSTIAGVIDRIAHNNGDCNFYDKHLSEGAGHYYGNLNRKRSFLLASVRNPASRAISRVFFHQVSRLGLDPTDENLLEWLNTTDSIYGSVSYGQGGFQLNYMTLDPIEPWSAFRWSNSTNVNKPMLVEKNVQRIIKAYDFLVVVERMEESLVALAMLLGVQIGDIVTLDTKVQGMYAYEANRCFKIVESHVSPRVKEYLSSDVWYAQNYGDYLLHAAANASLDKTIDTLGRSRFEAELDRFRKLKAMANEECASQGSRCSADGVPMDKKERAENCYKIDEGCGYHCIDKVVVSAEFQRVI